MRNQANQSSGRIIFDITTSVRWTGPPVGIVRVERELALWALAHLSNVQFVFFDPQRLTYCVIKSNVRAFLAGEAVLDALGIANPAKPGARKSDRMPERLRPTVLWIAQFRRMLLRRLEIIRLTARSVRVRILSERMQWMLLSEKYRKMLVTPDNGRRSFLPYDWVIGAPLEFAQQDTLLCAGSGWSCTNIRAISELKSRIGLRFVLLCYDLMPLLFPNFYQQRDVDLFRNYMHKALPLADLIVTAAHKIEEDCREYCAEHGIRVGETAVSPFGFDIQPRIQPKSPIPQGLSTGHFVLMVGTIEPRKGHRLLYNVWRRLTEEGFTQATGFKLVLVGRRGWMMDDLIKQIRTDQSTRRDIVLIEHADDALLDQLYQQAAFCVLPSRYEGYGLPVCEALAHGKAVIASTGGAIPELTQGLAPCLPPDDEEAWYQLMREWILTPERRAIMEREVQNRFRHPNWAEAAKMFFAQVAQ